MPLKNYTSSIAASRSISFIENKLASCGAQQIMKSYDDRQMVKSICFVIPVDGNNMPFMLEAQVAECEKVLEGMLTQRARPETRKKIPAQAERTAWKILADWVEAQMARIELSQVDFMQMFMHCLFDESKNQTLYQILKSKGFQKLLPAGD